MRNRASVWVLGILALTNSLMAGEAGVTDKEIVIGSSLPLAGAASYLGIQTNHGMNAYISHTNATGGVHGRKIRVIAYNDNYDPITCVINTKKLIHDDRVFALSCYIGTPTSVKAQAVWTNAKVPVVGFFTGAEVLRTPFNRYNVHIRASYYQETAAMIEVLVNELNFRKIAVFYQYDGFGEAVKKGTELALTKHGLTPVAYGNFERNTLNIENGLAQIKNSDPEAVVMVGTYAPLSKFVREAKKSGLNRTIYYTVSFVGPEQFAKELGEYSDRCLVTQVVPPYDRKDLPVANEYRKILGAYYPDDQPNFVSFEGFINAKVLIEGLKRAGKDLTREGLIRAIETIVPGQMRTGLKIEYGENDHQGIQIVSITRIQNGTYVEVKDWSIFK